MIAERLKTAAGFIDAASSMGKQLLSFGGRAAHAGEAAAGSAIGWARGGAAVGSLPGATQTATRMLRSKGQAMVRDRMIRRGLTGAAIGAGGSVVKDKLQHKDVSLGRAAIGGALGGGLGVAAGTTMGARGLRRLTAPHATPNMNLAGAANPLNKAPDVISQFPGRPGILSKGRSAFGNLSPLDKGFLGLSAVQAAGSITKPEHEGHRGEGVGSAVGMSAATLAGSRWKGLSHRGGGGALGGFGKSIGLYMGGEYAGKSIGRLFDRKRPQEAEHGSG